MIDKSIYPLSSSAETDSIFPEKILGIEFWIMATVLGGGGGM